MKKLKNKKIILVSFISVFLLVVMVLFITLFQKVPFYSVVKQVDLGETIRLEKGQFAKIKDADVYMQLVGFWDGDDCESGNFCLTDQNNTSNIGYKIIINNRIDYNPGYSVNLVNYNSDYKTYADTKIIYDPKSTPIY